MKIAVCDDSLNELELIRNFLDIYRSDSIQTFTVKYFESSVELASTLRFEKFDIYILDIIMPVMDGLALAKEIRTFDKAAPISCSYNLSYSFSRVCCGQLYCESLQLSFKTGS